MTEQETVALIQMVPGGARITLECTRHCVAQNIHLGPGAHLDVLQVHVIDNSPPIPGVLPSLTTVDAAVHVAWGVSIGLVLSAAQLDCFIIMR